MDWRDIPSLSALRAFEATARHKSFSAAARELNVTHAAIAQHVRGLEAFFAESLVFRSGSGLELTQAGRNLSDQLREGFETIAAGVKDLRDAGTSKPLKIALTPTFAENWLMPRVGAFWREHPEIELVLVPGVNLVDLRRDGFDLAIRYGHGKWDGLKVEKLVSANHVVVGTPELVAGLPKGDLAALCELPWVFEAGRPEQRVWAAEMGLDFSCMRLTELSTNSLVLSAARSGYGLSVQARALIETDLNRDTLHCVYEAAEGPLGYYMLTRPGFISPALKTFITWLHSVNQ